jgi:hypothetical protein
MHMVKIKHGAMRGYDLLSGHLYDSDIPIALYPIIPPCELILIRSVDTQIQGSRMDILTKESDKRKVTKERVKRPQWQIVS